jgi:hypothetical protein
MNICGKILRSIVVEDDDNMRNKLPKLLLIGHGRHGKDTVCEIFRSKYGYRFQSSSEFCAEKFIYPALKEKYGYSNFVQCYEDRHNHRQEWFEMIRDYSLEDPARLGKEIFTANDIYCGLRNKSEFHAMQNQGIFDYAIWVDRSDHLPEEDKTSMNLDIWMADYVIDNNGTLEQLTINSMSLMNHILRTYNAKSI